MNKIVLFIILLLMPTIANAQEVIAEMDKAGLSTLNEELRSSSASLRNTKSLVTTLQTDVDNLEAEFDTSTGHDHDGTDSKQIDYSNILNAPASGKKVFTSTGTFTAPVGVDRIFLSMCGAGGAGGDYLNEGGGGGSGAYIIRAIVPVTAGNNYTVTIGSGGTTCSSYSCDGNAGGNSSFAQGSFTITTNGGGGGLGNNTGGVAGTASGSMAGSSSARGGFGTTAGAIGGSGSGGNGGYGAGGYFGLGGTGAAGANAGNPIGFCSGGGGAGHPSYTATAGAGGFALIEW